MKKRFMLLIAASFLLFQGASPWEGSAAVAPNGELPVTGFYIATNAFPRNTVVEITNIETGKKTRVIVSNTLTSPGLLAIVSREAAELIDMKAGSISRIRMEQPSDPLAYMQFIEKMSAGVPEYDSGNVINEENLEADVYGNDTYMPPDLNDTVAESQKPPPSASRYIVDEEWREDGNLIVDAPYPDEPVEPFIEIPQVAQELPDFEEEEVIEYVEEYIEPEIEVVVVPEPEPIPEPEPEIEVVIIPEPEPEPEPIIEEQPYIADISDIEELLPPEEEIAEAELVVIPEEEIIESIPEMVIKPAELSPPTQTTTGIDRNKIIPSTVAAASDRQDSSLNENRNQIIEIFEPAFPVKMIDRLDRGKYYVQVITQPENLVMNTINHIDPSFDPKLFKGNDNLYRIMIGPLNQGESAAVLARFKSIGYKDAFVRMGG
jgi:hypothetical protein